MIKVFKFANKLYYFYVLLLICIGIIGLVFNNVDILVIDCGLTILGMFLNKKGFFENDEN